MENGIMGEAVGDRKKWNEFQSNLINKFIILVH